MRLNKFLALAGVASRRKCDEIIEAGRVCVNGKSASLGCNVNERKDKVEVDGVQVGLPENFVYLKLNKPKGYICSSSDEHGRKTVLDLVNAPERLFCIGRLDYDTEGLLLLTNDGDFAERLIHPRYELEKQYYVTIEGELVESEYAVLRRGVVQKGERMPPCQVTFRGFDPVKKHTKLSVVIHEGQNRQVRRMFEAIGKNIVLLKRVRIGKITLGGLERGKTKPLTAQEINSVLK